MSLTYTKDLSEPWFSLIKLKCKIVEGRLNKGVFEKMRIGDVIIFTNNELGFERRIKVEILNISHYDTFRSYLETETLERCLPGIDSMEDGLNVYYKYYTRVDEEQCKIKSLTLSCVLSLQES